MNNSVPLKPSCKVTILMMAGQDYFRWKNLNVGVKTQVEQVWVGEVQVTLVIQYRDKYLSGIRQHPDHEITELDMQIKVLVFKCNFKPGGLRM